MPVISVSIAEEEVGGIGAQNIEGQLTAWNYYQTIDTPVNKAFVAAYKAKFGPNKADLRPDGSRLHLGLPVEEHGGRRRSRSV